MTLKGFKWSKEAIENRAKALRGKKRTPEQRLRMSEARKKAGKNPKDSYIKGIETRRKNGWNRNPEKTSRLHSENNVRAMLGKKHSVETLFKMSLAHKGENNHNWDGGKTLESIRIRKSFEYRLWRSSVFKRDSYTCQLCGKHGGSLCADHIKPFALFPELHFDLENGRTLCISCHRKTDTYGYRAMYRPKKSCTT